MIARLYPKTLKLKQLFTTSHGAVSERQSILVELEYQGLRGLGEMVAVSYYGKTSEQFIHLFHELKPWLESLDLNKPESMFLRYEEQVKDRFMLSALDCATHDLYAKLEKTTVRERLGISKQSSNLSTLTVSIDTPEESAQFIKDNPWPIYKVKLGTEMDKEVIESIKSVTDAPLVVDANSGWSLGKTLEMAEWLKPRGVQFIEQPLDPSDKKSIELLTSEAELPIIADESCQTLLDLPYCLEYYDGINIKLLKCGGITPAMQMIKKARERNKMVMVGCMTESSIGISSGAQILPLVDFADIDGAYLLENDPADGVKLQRGEVIYPDRFGHGGIMKNTEQ